MNRLLSRGSSYEETYSCPQVCGLALSWPAEIYMLFYSGIQAEGAAPIWAILMAEDRKQETEVNSSSALKAHFVLAKRSH